MVSVDETDMVECPDVWRQSAVDAEDLSVYEGGDGQQVEHAAAVLPRVGVAVLGLALVVKPVHLGDLSGLVVASQQSDSVRPPGGRGNKHFTTMMI